MKKVIFALLALLILAVFCGCTGENAGNNTGGISNKVDDTTNCQGEDNDDQGGGKEKVPKVLSEEIKQLIKQEFLSKFNYGGIDAFDYFGTFNGYPVVFIHPATQMTWVHWYCVVWQQEGNGGNLLAVQQAYDLGMLTQDDVDIIHEELIRKHK